MKKLTALVICLSMLLSACGRNSVTDTTTTTAAATTEATTNTAIETTTEAASTEAEIISADQILADIDQYKADFISGNWDGSPIFIGGNVISVNAEEAEIWLNNDCIDEPLYCNAGENERFYFIDQDEENVYYFKDVESETEDKYFILQVNKQSGDTMVVEVPEETYSAKRIFESIFVMGEYSLYRIDFTSDNPTAVLLEECISDYEIRDYYSSVELHYITGERNEAGISFNKETGKEEVIEPHETTKARYSADEGQLTFYDNELYSKARELYANEAWDGSFIDLHTLDSEIEENTYASIDYNDNIVINNEIQGRYFRALQVEKACNVSETFFGPELVWFEDDFNQYLRFYFPNQEEEYCLHSYGTDLPFEIRGYTRMLSFYYDSNLVPGKTAGARVYLLTDGELWVLDCNFNTEIVNTNVVESPDHDIVDFNWAYDTLYYMLDNGEVYTIKYGEDDWDFSHPERFGGNRTFYALSHHTDESEGALSLNEGNYGDAHLYSPYGEKR